MTFLWKLLLLIFFNEFFNNYFLIKLCNKQIETSLCWWEKLWHLLRNLTKRFSDFNREKNRAMYEIVTPYFYHCRNTSRFQQTFDIHFVPNIKHISPWALPPYLYAFLSGVFQSSNVVCSLSSIPYLSLFSVFPLLLSVSGNHNEANMSVFRGRLKTMWFTGPDLESSVL